MAQDILITPGSGEPQILFRGSGTTDTAIELNVLSSYQSATGSGTALIFEGTEGQLFGITDNLSSGTIFSVSDISGLPFIEATASGDVKLGEYGRYVGVGTGVPLYGFDVSSSGQFQKGFVLSNYVPATTTNTLYNEGGTLKFNGSAVGGTTYTAGSGITIDDADRINVHGGSGHFLSLEVEDTLNISGVATFDQVSTFQSGVKTNINTEADAATITFDMDQSNVHMVTLGDSRTLAVSNVDVGQKFLIRLQQDSTGSRTVTWWSNIQWAEGGTEPTLTTTAGKADLFGFLSPSGGYYDGFVVGQNI